MIIMFMKNNKKLNEVIHVYNYRFTRGSEDC